MILNKSCLEKGLSMESKSVKEKILIGGASFLHPQNDSQPVWSWLPFFLLLAFILRAFVSLVGDFVIHPDEIMQYLEPAHQLVFGSGISYWEYFYGARSWIVPGVVSAILYLCSLAGMDAPVYYITAVKLVFCALSLFIPLGMYFFSRRHWNETTARLALLLGSFWYELIVFAHKPMTEFVATSLLFLLLAVFPLSPARGEIQTRIIKQAAAAGCLCALIASVRLQYVPVVGFIFILSWLAVGADGLHARLALFAGAAAVTAAVGILEMFTWGAPYHSYYVNFMMNVIVGASRAGESSPLILLGWWLSASCGLGALAIFGVVGHLKRRGLVVVLLLLILLPHMMQNHREYRFVYAFIPLWLLLLADFTAVETTSVKNNAFVRRKMIGGAAAFVSVLGLFNLIPFQHAIYTGFSRETGRVNFLRGQDPSFQVYRDLGADDSVRGVIDATRPYFNTGGYYYLHHAVPFYDTFSWNIVENKSMPAEYASHIITDASSGASPLVSVIQGRTVLLSMNKMGVVLPAFLEDVNGTLVYWNAQGQPTPLPSYEIKARYPDAISGRDMILWKNKKDRPVRTWKENHIISAYGVHEVIKQFWKSLPVPPNDYGVEFSER